MSFDLGARFPGRGKICSSYLFNVPAWQVLAFALPFTAGAVGLKAGVKIYSGRSHRQLNRLFLTHLPSVDLEIAEDEGRLLGIGPAFLDLGRAVAFRWTASFDFRRAPPADLGLAIQALPWQIVQGLREISGRILLARSVLKVLRRRSCHSGRW